MPAAKVSSIARQFGCTPRLTRTRWSLGRGDGQVDGLDAGGGAVVERCVGDLEAGEAGDDRLVLEQRLQHALGDLGLVRRVGGDELGAELRRAARPTESRGRRRRAPAKHTRSAPHGRLRPARRSISASVSGSDSPGAMSSRWRAGALGDDIEEIVERRQADEGQHRGDLVVGVGDVVTHAQRAFSTKGNVTDARGDRLATEIDLDLVSRRRSRAGRTPARCRDRALGEKFPLVTSPAGSPSTSTAHPWRGGWRPSTVRPRRRRAGPRSFSAASAARPRKSPLSQATTQPESGLQRGDAGPELVAVQRQRRPRAAACRGRRGRRASTPASITASQKRSACSTGTAHSTPSSPV